MMKPLVIAQSFMRGLDSQAFTAIAYFFAAGTIMNAGGMSARLLELARALVAHIRGGLAHANIVGQHGVLPVFPDRRSPMLRLLAR